MAVTAKMVKELREKTGAGMLNCKKALQETDGNMDNAIEFLRKKGMAKAEKKAGRVAAEGIIVSALSENSDKGVVLEFNTETDFSAKNDDVKNFANKLAKLVIDNDIKSVEDLSNFEESGKAIEIQLKELIAKIGENMNIRRFVLTESKDGFVKDYIHLGGKIGVLVSINGEKTEETEEIAKDVAMHAAAMAPKFIDKSEVTEEVLDKEKEIARIQLEKEGKPANIIDKILIGKMNKFYEENCLLQQKFVKDDKITVEKYLKKSGLKLVDCTRYLIGEGIEKQEDNFAEEVNKQVQGK